MSDFGAHEVNWRPPPRGRNACCERSEAEERLRESFLAKREKKAGGFGGRCKPPPPTGFGAEPRKILSFRCLNGLILRLLVTSKSCHIHDLHHHNFPMKPTSVNCSKLSISQYKQRVMI